MNTLSKSFMHPITQNYAAKIAAAGGSVADLNSVDNFVIELSEILDPKLWICWPLRSSQNIGSGTTAFSLGGLGNYEGTLINGPTWGADGLIHNSTSYIQSLLSVNAHSSRALVFSSSSSFSALFGSDTGEGEFAWGIKANDSAPTPTTSYAYINSFNFFTHPNPGNNFMVLTEWTVGQSVSVSGGIAYNGIEISSSSGTDIFPINVGTLQTPRAGSNGVIQSFDMAFLIKLTNSQWANIYNIYKRTLGVGLGLP